MLNQTTKQCLDRTVEKMSRVCCKTQEMVSMWCRWAVFHTCSSATQTLCKKRILPADEPTKSDADSAQRCSRRNNYNNDRSGFHCQSTHSAHRYV